MLVGGAGAGGAAAHHAPSAPAEAPAPKAPSQGVALGAFVGLEVLSTSQAMQRRERALGRRLAIASHYYDWSDTFPGQAEADDVAAGRTPMITWWGTTLADIANGSHDELILSRAAAVREFGHPVLIRWGAEMNGDWFAWSGSANGNDPRAFVVAWRRIVRLFASAGASNVSWVWAPNANSKPGGTDRRHWNNWRRYYPGDHFVDWVGIDGYNWGPRYGWQSFASIFGPIYRDYAKRKPIMIAETSSVEAGGSKQRWIADASRWIREHRAVKAVVWFDTDQSSTGIDWRIGSSGRSLAAFRRLARQPYFSAKLSRR